MDWKEFYLNSTIWNKNISWDICSKISSGITSDYNKCFDLSSVPPWQLYGHAIVMSVLILVSLFGNGLFLILFTKYRSLRYRTTIISMVIIFVNTAVIFSFHLPVLVSSISGKWIFSCTGCQVFGFLVNDVFFTYWLIMGALAFDRFCMVHFLCYPKHSKCILISLMVASLAVPFLLNTITVDEFSIVVFQQTIPTCIPLFPSDPRGKWVSFIIGAFTAFAGGAAPLLIHVILFWKATKLLHSRRRAAAVERNGRNEENVDPKVLNALQVCDTFAIIFFVSCVTQILAALFLMVKWNSGNAWCAIPHEVHFFAAELFSSTTAVTPFLIMNEKKFKRNIKLLIQCCCKWKMNSHTQERATNFGSATPQRSIHLMSFMSFSRDQRDNHSNISNFRARSFSFPVAARHKVYASSISRNEVQFSDTVSQRDSQGSLGIDINLSPSSYGIEEGRNMPLNML